MTDETVHIHLHVHTDDESVVLTKLDTLIQQGAVLMAKIEQFQNALAAVDAETTRIGTYISDIVAQLKRTDMTNEEEDAALAGLQAAAARLTSVGNSVEEPVPSGELPPVA